VSEGGGEQWRKEGMWKRGVSEGVVEWERESGGGE